MKLRLLTCLAALTSLVSTADFKGSIDLTGTIKIEKDGVLFGTIQPRIIRPNWDWKTFFLDLNKKAPEGTLFGSQGNARKKQSIVNLRINYKQPKPNVLDLEYIFTPDADTKAHALCASFYFDDTVFQGGAYAFDNNIKGIFPLVNNPNVVHLNRTQASTLNADGAMGRVTFNLDKNNTTLLQDNRKWNTKNFELRYSAPSDEPKIVGELVSTYKAKKDYVVKMTITLPEPTNLIQLKPIVMKADETWIPLKNELEIVKGSVIDFTDVVNLDAPAGKYGWTKADGQNFVFEKLPNVPQRFYGVNFCMDAHVLTHEESDIIADRLARFGYNTVRFHHHENRLTKFSRKDSCALDKDRLDQFHYLFAALKKRGIYMTTDVYVSREVNAHEIYPGMTGTIEMNEFKQLCAVNRNAMENWKKFARVFLGTKNPYTGLTLAEDPALNVICMVNEGVISAWTHSTYPEQFKAAWVTAWNNWLAKNFPTEQARKAIGLQEYPAKATPKHDLKTPLGNAYSHFLYDTHQAMYKEMTSFLKEELNCKALFSDMNNAGRNIWAQATRGTFDYVDDHFYIDHPRFLQTSWRLPSTCDNLSVMKTGNIGGGTSAFIRVLDRPFTITEWNYSGPGKYRGIGGIMTGCLASLQNWAGLWRFAYSHSRGMFDPDKRSAGYFDVVSDPFAQITERATICLFLRKDLGEAPNTIAWTIDENWVKNTTEPDHKLWIQWSGFNLVAKVGTFIGSPTDKVPAELSVPLTANAPKAANHIETQEPMTHETGDAVDAIVKKLNWLPKGNKTDFSRKIFQSVNNQFMIDGERNAMILNTPMTAGGFVEANDTIVTDVAQFKVRGSEATVWVSSVTKEPIKSSSRILLSHVTELHNSWQRYAEPERKTVLSWGSQPYLVHDGYVDALLSIDKPEEMTLYKVDLSGKRVAKVPTKIVDGKLAFTIRIKNPDGKAQLLYELTR